MIYLENVRYLKYLSVYTRMITVFMGKVNKSPSVFTIDMYMYIYLYYMKILMY